MKRSLASTILGIALLCASGIANAEQNHPEAGGWTTRLEESATSLCRGLAAWFERFLIESVAVPVPILPPPALDPGPAPNPSDSDEACNPERWHCPIG